MICRLLVSFLLLFLFSSIIGIIILINARFYKEIKYFSSIDVESTVDNQSCDFQSIVFESSVLHLVLEEAKVEQYLGDLFEKIKELKSTVKDLDIIDSKIYQETTAVFMGVIFIKITEFISSYQII